MVKKSKGWSLGEIREYQESRFQRLIRRYGSEVTEKEDYIQQPGKYTRWDLPLLTHTVRTGGTSGQPLRFTADTFARRQKERESLFHICAQVGCAQYTNTVQYARYN